MELKQWSNHWIFDAFGFYKIMLKIVEYILFSATQNRKKPKTQDPNPGPDPKTQNYNEL